MSHIKNLQNKMKETGAEALIVTSEVNQRYLTGFPYTDGYVAVTQDKAYLVTDFRYIEAAKAAVDGNEFEIVMPTNMLQYIKTAFDGENVKTYLFEEETLSFSQLEKIKNILAGMSAEVGASKIIDGLRIFKDFEEIECLQHAQSIADAAFEHILKVMKPDMTEIEVALELEFFMRRNGAEGISFETIAVSGTNSSRPHGVPRNVKLEKGFLTMDYGCKYNGYCSDMTRTVVIGKADAEMKKVYDTVLTAHLSALAEVREGADCKGLDKIARDIIYGAGYEGCFGHSLGHGVGLYIHESPRLSPGIASGMKLERGNVVTVEPGIYIEGKYGCRIEDTVAIRPDGKVQDFAHSPKDMIELF